MKPLLFSFAAMADFMRKSIEKLPLPPATVHTGPGRKTLYTLHKGAHSSRYTGADIRRLNAERGVGRPPHKRQGRAA